MISGTSSRRHSNRDRIILRRAPPAQGTGATFGIATDEPFKKKCDQGEILKLKQCDEASARCNIRRCE